MEAEFAQSAEQLEEARRMKEEAEAARIAAESQLAMLSETDSTGSAAGNAVAAAAKVRTYGPHQMVPVEGGCFMMGSKKNMQGRRSDEDPHYLCLDDFLIDRYETTFEAYDQFAQQTGRELPDDEGMGRGRRPVINVEYEDALAYAEWASKKYDINFRLPTEAEWEYACRSGGKEERYCGGENPQELAVFNQEKTMPVGSKKSNGLGLYDMSGNAFELTCSPYISMGQISTSGYDGSEMICSSSWLTRTLHDQVSNSFRGGSWESDADEIRSHARHWQAAGVGNYYIRRVDTRGFRLVATETKSGGSLAAEAGKPNCSMYDDPDYASFAKLNSHYSADMYDRTQDSNPECDPLNQ
jgi:formylglycine-generating enzyme required for sulfatase activity